MNTDKQKMQFESLNNAVISTELENFKVVISHQNDKRKTTPLFFLSHNNVTISPTLDYDKMNHFILGFSKALKINKNK